MRQFLVLLCLFVAAAGTWLGVMENVRYAGRSVMAVCIAFEAMATLPLFFGVSF